MVTETPSPPKALTKSDQWLDLVKAFEHRDVIAAKAFTKNDQWLVLVKEMRGYRGRINLKSIWKYPVRRAGRASGLKSHHTPWPGNFSIHHILLRRCRPGFDFINPDCHLYVSKVTLILRSQEKILKERFSFRSFLINRHLTSIIKWQIEQSIFKLLSLAQEMDRV